MRKRDTEEKLDESALILTVLSHKWALSTSQRLPLSRLVPDFPFFPHATISSLGWRWIYMFISVLLDSLDYRERQSLW